MASVVDGTIVGNLLGDLALAAVGLSGPIIFCINLIYMLLGIGGLTCTPIARGKRETHQANLVFDYYSKMNTYFQRANQCYPAFSAHLHDRMMKQSLKTALPLAFLSGLHKPQF